MAFYLRFKLGAKANRKREMSVSTFISLRRRCFPLVVFNLWRARHPEKSITPDYPETWWGPAKGGPQRKIQIINLINYHYHYLRNSPSMHASIAQSILKASVTGENWENPDPNIDINWYQHFETFWNAKTWSFSNWKQWSWWNRF